MSMTDTCSFFPTCPYWCVVLSVGQCSLGECSLTMQENHMIVALGKEGGGGVTMRGGRCGGGGLGGGDDEGITKLKTSVISAAAERKQCLLLGGACLATCSRGWVQHCGMTLLLNVYSFFICLSVFSPNRRSGKLRTQKLKSRLMRTKS